MPGISLFASFRGYRAAWLGGDLIAGVMLAAIAIPEQLATAKLAGFPVEAGLYAFAAGSVAFAVLGANRFLSAGADSTIAPVFAASLGALATFGGHAYHGLAAVLALGVGAILIAIGVGRFGWIADLLSIPVTTGVLAGISAHIVIGQLPSFLGITSSSGALLRQLFEVAAHVTRSNPYTLSLGFGVLGVTVLAARVSERIPGALIGLIGAAAAVAAFDLRARGVAVIGSLHAGLPHVGIPLVSGIGQLTALVPLALIVAAVCTLQTSVVVRSFPSQADYADDVSPDFTAIGAGSIVAALCGAFPVNASPPRTAVAQGAGGRSQLSGLVAVAAIAIVVAFFAKFAAFVPEGALAGVLIFVGLRIFRLRDMVKIARYSRREINLVVVGALLVIVLPIQTGMLLAIMLSLAHGLVLLMWPASTQLFQVRGTTVWWPATGERDVVDVPGIVVFEPAAALNFTNAQFIVERLQACVTKAKAPVTLLVIEGSAISDVDYTGSQTLQAKIAELRSRGTDVALARLIVPHAQRAAERSGLIAALGRDHVFKSVQEAIAALHAGAGK